MQVTRGCVGAEGVARWHVSLWIAPTDFNQSRVDGVKLPKLEAPSSAHWFGTNDQFYDILSRMIWGARTAIEVVVFVTAVFFLGWGADSLARMGAEAVLARNIQSATGVSEPPVVNVRGFAFLPQFFSGTLDELDVSFALDGESIPALAGDSAAAGRGTARSRAGGDRPTSRQ